MLSKRADGTARAAAQLGWALSGFGGFVAIMSLLLPNAVLPAPFALGFASVWSAGIVLQIWSWVLRRQAKTTSGGRGVGA
jgi:hypothetical protein